MPHSLTHLCCPSRKRSYVCICMHKRYVPDVIPTKMNLVQSLRRCKCNKCSKVPRPTINILVCTYVHTNTQVRTRARTLAFNQTVLVLVVVIIINIIVSLVVIEESVQLECPSIPVTVRLQSMYIPVFWEAALNYGESILYLS